MDTLKVSSDFYTYPPFKEKFSIIFPTHFKRIPTLRKSLEKIVYGQSKYLAAVFIYWIDRDLSVPPPDVSEYVDVDKIQIHIEVLNSEKRRLTDRFLRPKNLETRAVYVCDDDINPDAELLDSLFEMYLSNHFRDFMFGSLTRSCYNGRYEPYKNEYFNMVLTGACFLDAAMLDLYQLPIYKKCRNWINKRFNGEDIMMNYIVEHNFKTPPIAVLYNLDGGPFGLSSRSQHQFQRSEACTYFRIFFGNEVPREHSRKTIYEKITNELVEVDSADYY